MIKSIAENTKKHKDQGLKINLNFHLMQFNFLCKHEVFWVTLVFSMGPQLRVCIKQLLNTQYDPCSCRLDWFQSLFLCPRQDTMYSVMYKQLIKKPIFSRHECEWFCCRHSSPYEYMYLVLKWLDGTELNKQLTKGPSFHISVMYLIESCVIM